MKSLGLCAALLLVCVAECWAGCAQLVTDFSQASCINKTKHSSEDSFYYGLDVSNCVPTCYKYSDVVDQPCGSGGQCVPGYSCQKRCGPDDDLKTISCNSDQDCATADGQLKTCGSYCVADGKASCMAYHINNSDYQDSYWSAIRFKPACNNDGTWQAKQCKGGVNGRCMCFDSNGGRIFGEALAKSAANMTCACSRRNADLQLTRLTSFHCDSLGNYEPLQCDLESDQCWCMEPLTGALVSKVVPFKALSLLPCYSEDAFGSQYLRQCESKKYAQTKIKDKLNRHGVVYLTQDRLMCDIDGSFGAYTIENDSIYCTWRNNSKIGSWQTGIQYIASVDCNCARDYFKYGQSQNCQSNGNYKALQSSDSYWYCVDADDLFTVSSVSVNRTQYSDYASKHLRHSTEWLAVSELRGRSCFCVARRTVHPDCSFCAAPVGAADFAANGQDD
ncbi:hypothetical protein HUJ04_004577 [Dendroctonus ponderosae]|nr:hypothetical protein HUJ04_004577 [Dendroctonus ponderosae]